MPCPAAPKCKFRATAWHFTAVERASGCAARCFEAGLLQVSNCRRDENRQFCSNAFSRISNSAASGSSRHALGFTRNQKPSLLPAYLAWNGHHMLSWCSRSKSSRIKLSLLLEASFQTPLRIEPFLFQGTETAAEECSSGKTGCTQGKRILNRKSVCFITGRGAVSRPLSRHARQHSLVGCRTDYGRYFATEKPQ